jgi:TusA-related sulfurtransferase
MNTNKVLSTGLLALTVGVAGFGAGIATQGASADSHEFGGEKNFERPPIEREVTLLSNGAQIEITSDEDAAVEKIQERAQNAEQPENAEYDIDFSYQLIDDGVIITMTSDDADAVEAIQERAEQGPKHHGPKGEGEHHCERDDDDLE